MPKFDIQQAIAATNARLKSAGIPAYVWRNGQKLVIKATVPNKPGEPLGTKQRDISLGISASAEGLKEIERKCYDLDRQLSTNTFTWENWQRYRRSSSNELSTAKLIENFRVHHQRSHRINPETWRETWQRTFDRLPQNESLTEASILAVVLSSEAHTRSRELTCQRLQSLANYAGITIDLKPYKGNYGHGSEQPRDIPTDDLIVDWRDRIPNPTWQWVYGMLATFGLRPHEAFFCEFVDRYTLKILEGKTGYHVARAIRPEWAEAWNLIEINRPSVKGSSYRIYGQRTYRQFRRYEVPFVPYDLRHAYAIRGSVTERLPIPVMATFMGHSTNIHTKTYHRWLTDATNEKVYRELILKQL